MANGDERQNWVELFEQREKELSQFSEDVKIKAKETLFEQLKNKRESQEKDLNKLPDEEKAEELAGNVYDTMGNFYVTTFLGINQPNKFWGARRLSSMFADDSDMVKEKFIGNAVFGDRLNITSLEGLIDSMGEKLINNKKLASGITDGLTLSKKGEFVEDLKNKLNGAGIAIDSSKVKTLDEAMAIYSHTKQYSGLNEQLRKALKDYLVTN